jgi:putative transcription factor
MSGCEMCGKEGETRTYSIEGVELLVCDKCSNYGTPVKRTRKVVIQQKAAMPQTPLEETIEVIREDFPKLIRDKREKLGLKQEEFAKFLSERGSLIHKMESGSFVPPIDVARKIEKILKISLIEEKKLEASHIQAKKETFTIGDMIKLK